MLALTATRALADTPQVVLEELVRCADMADSQERLRCFDVAAARARMVLASPPATGAGDAAGSSPDSFGLARPPTPVARPEQFGKPVPRAEELQSITATAIEFAKTPHGKALFVLDNGQVWRQLDSDGTEVVTPRASGIKVTIERGAFGSYNLTMDGRSALIKVARVR